MDVHPRVNQLTSKLQTPRIILGSFPTWSLAISDLGIKDNKLRIEQKIVNGDLDFFYGSRTNQFWKWYSDFLDENIILGDISSIQHSLKNQNIGITDVIYSCERVGKSALDSKLKKRNYNHNFFIYPDSGKVLKVLCTSKGVLNEMLLNKKFHAIHPSLKINDMASLQLQNTVLTRISSDRTVQGNPIARVLNTPFGGRIECVAIPSPGSPYRALSAFGKGKLSNKDFLNKYLGSVFTWFNN